ncbi:acetyltransferase (GNAT) family protein [Actinocorallia herbida]|uniref:Acetyltransferase (GNAT) family protein n=1 Tax=Actinocorallia herbida TaxID=58109 RepID=A0A3N1D617_9ACTN|nr:GNAT family N-acetyltransferase [Actinocorallia herbida]ROO88991.1 acetyltransferase (GNAT) family protein [Actinocorallia herbida]
MPDFARLDGPSTLAVLAEIQRVYAAAFPGHPLTGHARRAGQAAASPGFATVTARERGRLVGFACGLPLQAPTTWWHGLRPARPPSWTTETGARTFAVLDLGVLPAHRGTGTGRRLVDGLLAYRAEERATLATAPDKPDIQRMYQRWGWRLVGRVPGGPEEAQPFYYLYVLPLRVRTTRP